MKREGRMIKGEGESKRWGGERRKNNSKLEMLKTQI